MRIMTLRIPIILGTVRAGRESEKIAKFYLEKLRQISGVETELFDIRSMELPMNDEGTALRHQNPAYRDLIAAADGIIIVTPEYNHGYPGSLKRALDVLDLEYKHKAAALCTVSSGYFAGARVAEALIHVLRKLGLYVVRTDVYNAKITEFDPAAENAFLHRSIESQIQEVIWLARTLKNGREAQGNGES